MFDTWEPKNLKINRNKGNHRLNSRLCKSPTGRQITMTMAATLKDNKVMKQVTDKILNQFPEAGDAWIKSVLDVFIKLRLDKNTGAISLREVKNLQNFLKENNESLSTMFTSIKGDKIGEEHLKNLNLIAAGFEKVNLVP